MNYSLYMTIIYSITLRAWVHQNQNDSIKWLKTTKGENLKLDLNTEQLEFLQFILDNFEYNDDEERALKDSIESQLYEVREQDLLIAKKIASSHINPLGGN